MFQDYLEQNISMLLSFLKRRGVEMAPGLSRPEFEDIEKSFGFEFPSDLRYLLQITLPVSENWVNWRPESKESIARRLKASIEGIWFDVDKNGFWLDEWGMRPENNFEARQIVEKYFPIAIFPHYLMMGVPQFFLSIKLILFIMAITL